MRRRGEKTTGKSHSICRQHFLSARQKTTKRTTERVAHPRQTSRIVTFVYVFLTLFYAIFPMAISLMLVMDRLLRPTGLCVQSAVQAQKPGCSMHGSPLSGLKRSDPVCMTSGASPVGGQPSALPWNQLLVHQSIRGVKSPQWKPNMLAAIDVCNTKKIVAWRRFSSTKAWNPEKHCFWQKWFTIL